MRYALIADIHGNLHALQAVLDDAGRRRADACILLGDYNLSCAYPDEVTTLLRKLKPRIAVSGNEEIHLKNLMEQDQSTWTDGQLQAVYQSFRALSDENRRYMARLPEEAAIRDGRTIVTAFHDFNRFFGLKESKENRVSSNHFATLVRDRRLTPKQAVERSKAKLTSNPRLRQSMDRFPDGVYLFGHEHLQYHLELGGKLCVNPGSCGLPLDGIGGAPYSILEISSSGAAVEEHRAVYDLDGAIDAVLSSPMYPRARVWFDIIVMELRQHLEHAGFFLEYAQAYAASVGDPVRPYSRSTWENAFAKWVKEKRFE